MAHTSKHQRYVTAQRSTSTRTYSADQYQRNSGAAHKAAASHAVRPRPAQPATAPLSTPPSPEAVSTKEVITHEPAVVSQPKAPKQRALIQDTRRPVASIKPQKSQVLQRHVVAKPYKKTQTNLLKEVPKPEKTKNRLPLRLKTIFSSVVVMLLVAGSGSFAAFAINDYHNSRDNSAKQVLSGSSEKVSSAQTEQQANVDETPISQDDINGNSVPDDYPKRMNIETINIEARIKAGGVNRYQQLVMPSNIYDVNWYEGSRLPGQRGTVLMSGYVSGPTERGAFYYLRAAEHGDEIEIETGDGTTYTYEIKHRERVPYDELDIFDALVPYEMGGNWLHLIAVDDRYNVMNNGYQDRLIIYAEQK